MIPIVISSILFIILAFMTKGFAGIYSILLIFVSALVILAAIKIIVKDSIISVLYLILMLIIGSIIPPEFQIIFTYLVLVSSILLILFSWNLFKDLISLSYEKIIKISWLNIGAWFLIFSYIC